MQTQPNVSVSRSLVPVGIADLELTRAPEGLSFGMALSAVWRRKGFILFVVLLVNGIVLGCLNLVPNHYTAIATLMVEHSMAHEDLVGKPLARGIPPWQANDDSTMLTQISLLKTRALAAKVVDELDLVDDPEFQSFTAAIRQRLAPIGQRWAPAIWASLIGSGTQDLAQRQEVAIRKFQREMSVQQQDRSHVLQVRFTSVNADKAAKIANTIAGVYLQMQIDAKLRSTNKAYQWATAELRHLKRAVEEAELDVVSYMASHNLTAANGLAPPIQPPSERSSYGGLTGQQLTKLQEDIATARAQLAGQEAKLGEVNRLQAKGHGYGALAEVLNSPVIIEYRKADAGLAIEEAQLASRYAYSPVLGKIRAQRAAIATRIAEETQNIVRSIRDNAEFARERVQRMEAMLASSRKEYVGTERSSVELRELNRTAAAERARYETVLLRLSDIEGQRAFVEPDAEVISGAAVPTRPSYPNKLVIGGVGFLGSLVVGFGLAGLLEHGDDTLRTGKQIEEALGVRILGLVPELKYRRRHREPLATLAQNTRSAYVEAVRSILLQLVPDRRQPQVILVTSALPGEGKTGMAVALAAVAAGLGRRAAVVDFDLHNPSIARTAGLSVRMGLAEFMSGEADFDTIVQVDESYSGRLSYIPLRGAEDCPPEVLHGWALDKLKETMRGRFDCIVLDAPPALAASDIQAIGTMADKILFVAQWGKTSCSAAAGGLAALSRMGLAVHGAALTRVDPRQHAGYRDERFGDYHRRYVHYFRS